MLEYMNKEEVKIIKINSATLQLKKLNKPMIKGISGGLNGSKYFPSANQYLPLRTYELKSQDRDIEC
jgi:hypothetical protein